MLHVQYMGLLSRRYYSVLFSAQINAVSKKNMLRGCVSILVTDTILSTTLSRY